MGRLGTAEFPRGFYVYCGSALGGLHGRVHRHLRKNKRLRWHIDYLLAAAEVEEVWTISSPQRLECVLSQEVARMKGATLTIKRFGASDCRCPTHLWFFKRRPCIGELGMCVKRLPPSDAG